MNISLRVQIEEVLRRSKDENDLALAEYLLRCLGAFDAMSRLLQKKSGELHCRPRSDLVRIDINRRAHTQVKDAAR
jgi:hypothetical protein